CQEHYDHLRTALMFEPRGHADMYGCILTPPNDEDGDFGIIFLHNEGYSTMCGHAIIAIATLAVQMKWIDTSDGEHTLKIDAPCGRIHAFIKIEETKVMGVRFHCVPSFVVGLDRKIVVEGLGEIIYDLAYGGAFYAYVDIAKNPQIVALEKSNIREIIHQAMSIKKAVMRTDKEITHPHEQDLSFLYGTIFIDPRPTQQAQNKNVCVFADGEVDRSPTGSGVSGRMAIHHARKELAVGESMTIESITGSVFQGKVFQEITYGAYPAVIPEVTGTAHISGEHTFIIDPNDPMKNGFLVR
ncbi:MAG: proline racemase family protein, partial [Bacteroidota bacterium]